MRAMTRPWSYWVANFILWTTLICSLSLLGYGLFGNVPDGVHVLTIFVLLVFGLVAWAAGLHWAVDHLHDWKYPYKDE